MSKLREEVKMPDTNGYLANFNLQYIFPAGVLEGVWERCMMACEEKYEEQANTIKTCQNEIRDLENKVKAAEEEIKKLDKLLDECGGAYLRYLKDYDVKYKSTVEELKQLRYSYDYVVKSSTKTIEKLEHENGKLKFSLNAANYEKENIEKVYNDLKSNPDRMATVFIRTGSGEYMARIEKLEAKIRDMQNGLQVQGDALLRSYKNFEDLEKLNTQLKDELKKVNNNVLYTKNLEKENKEQWDNNARLSAHSGFLQDKVENLEKTNETYKKQIEFLRGNNGCLQRPIKNLMDIILEKNKNIQKLKEQIEYLTTPF